MIQGSLVPVEKTCTQNDGTSVQAFDYIDYKQTAGQNTPSYYKKRATGALLPVTSWTNYSLNATFSGGRTYDKWNAQSGGTKLYTFVQSGFIAKNAWGSPQATPTYAPTAEDVMSLVSASYADYVVTGAINDAASAAFDALTFAAELGKTLSMFRQVGTKLTRFQDLASDQLAKGEKAATLASLWLEGRYGWRTLMYDVRALDDALNVLSKKSAICIGRSSYSSSTSGSWPSGGGTWLNRSITSSSTYNASVEYRGLCYARIQPQAFGGDVATTLWELVPYSFVIDWFFNVGQKIAYLGNSLKLQGDYSSGYGTYVSGTYTAEVVMGARTVSRTGSGSSWWDGLANSALCEGQFELKTRVPATPGMLPLFAPRLDVSKVIDTMSMVYLARGKLSKVLAVMAGTRKIRRP